MDVKVTPGALLEGTIDLPTSKSQTLRALYAALIAKGTSLIYDPLDSDDAKAMIHAISLFGAKVVTTKKGLIVHSPGFHHLKPPSKCFVGESGITLRFLSAFAALFKTPVTFYGAPSLMKQRSIKDLEWGLKQLGVTTKSAGGLCPFTVTGPIKASKAVVLGHDSQPVSALLWLLSLQEKKGTLFVMTPKEKPWVELTLSWLKKNHASIYQNQFRVFKIQKKARFHSFIYTVPKDLSSCAFIVAAGLMSGRSVSIPKLDLKDLQGDRKLFYVLRKLCPDLKIHDTCILASQATLENLNEICVEEFIDALPVVATLATWSQKEVKIFGAKGARGKESDRIHSMTSNLLNLGVKVKQWDDGMIVYPSEIIGGECASFNDHRIAMASALLGLVSKKPVIIKEAQCIQKTYPKFFEDLVTLGAKVTYL